MNRKRRVKQRKVDKNEEKYELSLSEAIDEADSAEIDNEHGDN